MKKLLLLIFILFFSFTRVSTANAHNIDEKEAPPVNSFELFWPLSPGKTNDDGMYFLKILKEKVRYQLIFGNSEKAENLSIRATKRLLEAEFLLGKSKVSNAEKSVDASIALVKELKNKFSSEVNQNSQTEVKNRFDNLIKLNDYLISQTQGEDKSNLHGKLHSLHSSIEDILNFVKL